MPVPSHAQIVAEKAALRAGMTSFLAAIPSAEVARRSALVCERLGAWVDDRALPSDRRTVLVFAAMPSSGEVELWPFVDRWRRGGNAAALPRIEWASRTMTPVPVRDRAADVLADARGIPMPHPDLAPIDPATLGAVVVPGLAFDATGGRLGRGMGFYDRFLASLPASVRTVAAVFDEQVIDRVPMEPHDRRVSAIVTDRRTIDA